MSNNLSQEKIAILAANGFNQNEMTSMQRALQSCGAGAKVIAMGNTLLQGWDISGWGHSFVADQLLNEALAADYTMLIIPGGKRSVETLKTTAHTKRFLRGFMDMNKQVVIFSDAVELLAHCECDEGRKVASEDEAVIVDGQLITVSGTDVESNVSMVMDELAGFTSMQKAA